MKQLFTTFILMITVLTAYNCSSEALPKKDSATLTIFHTNDILGYLTPCG